jgi:hypothetical protein
MFWEWMKFFDIIKKNSLNERIQFFHISLLNSSSMIWMKVWIYRKWMENYKAFYQTIGKILVNKSEQKILLIDLFLVKVYLI